MAHPQSDQQVATFVPPQNAHSVLRIASETAKNLFQKWCNSPGNGDDLDRAVEILRSAVNIADAFVGRDSDTAIGLLLDQGGCHQERLFRKCKKADADMGVLIYQDVLRRDPNNFKALIWLSWIRKYQYDMTGQRSMLDEALELANEAFFADTDTDNEVADAVNFTALCLMDRADFDGSMDDLDVMVELLRFGLSLEGLSHDGPILLRLILAEGLALRYSVTEQEKDLSEAEGLLVASQSLPVTPHHNAYQNLVKGSISHIRFNYFKQQQDIIASTGAYRDARLGILKNSSCSTRTNVIAGMRLAQVARESYHWKPSHLMIHAAHNFAKLAMSDAELYIQDWHCSFSLVELHWTLGEIQRSRYFRYRSTDLLDYAITHFRECVHLSSIQDARFARRAAELSGVLRLRFKSEHASNFQKIIDRHEAIYRIAQLLQARRPFRPTEMQICLIEIGDLLQDLVIGSMTTHRLDQAMRHYQLAINIETLAFGQRVDSWTRMVQALIYKGGMTDQPEDRLALYQSAEHYLTQVKALADQRKCQSTGHLPLLARLYEEKYWLTHDVKDAARALETDYGIFHDSNYEVIEKLCAARRYTLLMGKIQYRRNESPYREHLQLLEESNFGSLKDDDATKYTIDLMIQRVSDASDRDQQLLAIRQEALVPLSCLWRAAVARKSAYEMLGLYERGRSILWDRLINSKTQIDLLEEKHTELAQRYRLLRKRLQSASEPDPRFTGLPLDRYECAAELDDVIREIHRQPGFEDFLLLPLSQKETQGFATQGYIIYLIYGPLNTSGFALTITPDAISVVYLPGFTGNQCEKQFDQLKRVYTSREDSPDETDAVLGEVLKWLWYSAAEPVLRALHLIRTPLTNSKTDSIDLPRVWWITSNWVSRLPIHAAGDHDAAMKTGAPTTVMDNVASSYTPTLRALKYSRSRLDQLRQTSSTNSSPPCAMLVAMQETPDRRNLKYAVPEVEKVRDSLLAEMPSTMLTSPNVTRKTVVKNLRHCTIAHLACHGEADPHDPLKSRLMFEDWYFKSLRVGFLMRMEMSSCQLAYLSACQTAVNEDQGLIEEGLHLSGAFQMAGVPNTIATFWEILDEEAVDVAGGFYDGLKDENGKIDIRRCARSLHATTMALRNRGLSPYIWGSYVHFGA